MLTNPRFNLSESGRDQRREGRRKYGAPPLDGDKFAWVQHCLSRLRAWGPSGVIMPNKAGNSGLKAEQSTLRKPVKGGAIDCVVALPA